MRLRSRSRIAAFLNQEGFTRKYERHSELPQPQTVAPQRPHEEWEMDAQGVIDVSSLGPVSIINIGDFFSRLKVDSFPCLDTHPSTLDHQLVLRRAFVRYGLPERISVDHDSVFYDNACASPSEVPVAQAVAEKKKVSRLERFGKYNGDSRLSCHPGEKLYVNRLQ